MDVVKSRTQARAFPRFLLYSTAFAYICLYLDYLSIPPFSVSHSSLFIIPLLSPHSSVFPCSAFHNGWLCLHPIAYQHELCFILCVFERVRVCSVPTKAWYYTPENRHSTFHLVTAVLASPAHFISCIICILLASISQRAICFCHTLLYFLVCSLFPLIHIRSFSLWWNSVQELFTTKCMFWYGIIIKHMQ